LYFYKIKLKTNKMNAKQFTLSTLIGGVVFFVLGYLLYVVLFAGFLEANQGTATGVSKEVANLWVVAIGNLSLAGLLTLILGRWAGISTFGGGVKAGVLIGLLMGLSFDLIMFGTTNIMNFAGMVADVVIFAVMTGLTGGAIGWWLGRSKTA
jgi:hypothetical protein